MFVDGNAGDKVQLNWEIDSAQDSCKDATDLAKFPTGMTSNYTKARKTPLAIGHYTLSWDMYTDGCTCAVELKGSSQKSGALLASHKPPAAWATGFNTMCSVAKQDGHA